MRKSLSNVVTLLTTGLAMVSCIEKYSYEQEREEQALNNAEQTLGFAIPEGQDWVMTSKATATISIKGLNDNNCTLYVFSNSPQTEGYGSALATSEVTSATTVINDILYPSHLEGVTLGLKQSNGNMTFKYVDIVDGQINATYDFSDASKARTRSITVNGDNYEAFNFPSNDELKAAFPTAIPANADEVADLETLYKGTTVQTQYGQTTMGDLYAIYANKIVEGYNLKITKKGNGTVELGGSYQNSGWDSAAGKEIARPYNVYVNVDGDLTIRRNGATHFNLYILKGNVTLESNYGEQAGSISVAAGATLNDQRNSVAANQGVKIYNRGTINATNSEKYDIGNFCTVYNEGKFNISSKMSYSPGDANTSYFINYGDDAELSAASMTLNSSCHFYNSGKVNITDDTFVTQSGIYWINNGHYTTGTMTFSAKNATFYNYCQLLILGNAHMYDGEFNLMNDSYTETNTADFDNFIVNMGGNAGFNVKNGSNWGAQGDGTFQGFRASGVNNYVRLGGNTTVARHQYSLQTTGNITIAVNNIIDLGAGNSGVQPTVQFNEGKKEIAFSKLNATSDENSCGATWSSSTTVVTPPVTSQVWTYAFEDNTIYGDYDMNDVVLKVSEDPNNENQLIVKLVAAGCEFDNELYYDETPIMFKNKRDGGETNEVHAAFGVAKGTLVNTGEARSTSADIVETTITKPAGFSFQNAKFNIVPQGGNDKGNHIGIATSGAPCGIMIPTDWQYPEERERITKAYATSTHEFKTWATSADHSEAKDWYSFPSGKVMTKN